MGTLKFNGHVDSHAKNSFLSIKVTNNNFKNTLWLPKKRFILVGAPLNFSCLEKSLVPARINCLQFLQIISIAYATSFIFYDFFLFILVLSFLYRCDTFSLTVVINDGSQSVRCSYLLFIQAANSIPPARQKNTQLKLTKICS